MTKIDVISGFLGSGKTTFIKCLLNGPLKNEKTVLIENEFGEISVDGGFLRDSGVIIKEMSQGCICCSLVGDFEKSLREVISSYAPERVIIEPSGVGKLSDVMKAVKDASKSLDVVLNSAVTLVNVKKCRMYLKNFGEFFVNQVQYAGTIVLTRTDVASDKEIQDCVELIRTVNKDAEIITTHISLLPAERLLAVIEKRDDMLEAMLSEALKEPDGETEEEHEAHHHHHHHEHDEDENEEHEHHHHHHEHDEDEDEEHEHEHHHHHHEHDEDEDEEHEHEHHHHHHHGHDADEIFDSFGEQNLPPITKDRLEELLKAMSETDRYGDILRCKGMIKDAGSDIWYHFDMVPGEYEIREGLPEYTGKACVIGNKLKKAGLKEAFYG